MAAANSPTIPKSIPEIEVSAVPPDQIAAVLDGVLEALKGCERQTRGRYRAEDMVSLCLDGRSVLFVAFSVEGEEPVIHGAVVAAVNEYPRRRLLLVQFVGGDRSRLWRQNMSDLIERFARDSGCDGIEGVGRLGWMRLFPQFIPVAVMGEWSFVGGRGQ